MIEATRYMDGSGIRAKGNHHRLKIVYVVSMSLQVASQFDHIHMNGVLWGLCMPHIVAIKRKQLWWLKATHQLSTGRMALFEKSPIGASPTPCVDVITWMF
jgi:hypothetical protein